MDRETGFVDDDYLTETCRQCGDVIAVRPDDERPDDGPWICDDCVRITVNRAARSPLSNFLFDELVNAARRAS